MPRYRQASVGWARDVSDLSAALRGLASKDTQVKILERAVGAACQPILVAAKRYAKRSEDTGALRDSLTVKTVGYRSSGKAVGLVGPDRAYRVRGKKVGALGALLGIAKGGVRRPANYAHLVEFGHRIAKGGRLSRLDGRGSKGTGTDGGWVAAKPFLRPAVITTRVQQAAAFEQAVAAGLDAALRRHNKRAGTPVRYQRAA